ncbi:Pyridoxamine 5'-phosphate oxidase [Desulfotomaculum arcticum]|uniref:Pyridoxamine 5'-phosphate oxidase n=1 Tax=Desulfotruncus arcticus DSM 17038 TaxID=1121424 RepID=A0A1I2NYW6_9FIRM|nr:pyridoxamine 5'-phosphate oxidase family protein [Desulfotruncus arcticus]SFG06827.1 Pyridoxamine 5'-phosphate oxidase [Desulfotomaculum arcticum] [Desulfotruncus arcticus DSM 17038]
MVSQKLSQVLEHEGVVAIATLGEDGPHLVNTWNSYIQITTEGNLLIPAGGMNQTEANVVKNNKVLVTMGSREVEGLRGPGTGFLIKGTAAFVKSGPQFDTVKQKFPWARAAVEITVGSATQTL